MNDTDSEGAKSMNKTLPIANLQFTNSILINLGLNPDLHGGSVVTNRPNHDTAIGKSQSLSLYLPVIE
jgi:hypothetical protein